MLDPPAIKRFGLSPLLEVTISLEQVRAAQGGWGVVFSPGLGKVSWNGEEGLREAFTTLVRDWLNVGHSIKRLDTRDGGSYMKEVEDSFPIKQDIHELMAHLDAGERECEAFLDQFLKYRSLWEVHLSQGFELFKKEFTRRPSLQQQQQQQQAEEPSSPSGGDSPITHHPDGAVNAAFLSPPALCIPLDAFDRKIGHYMAIKEEIGELAPFNDIAWLRVDAKQIRRQLLALAQEWASLYTEHLLNEVQDSVTEALGFLQDTNTVFDKQVPTSTDKPGGQEEALLDVLTSVRQVGTKAEAFNHFAEPLKAKSALLRKYRCPPSDETLAALEDFPAAWEATKVKMQDTKDCLNPLIIAKATEVKGKAVKFGHRLSLFREDFLKGAPFGYVIGGLVSDAYALLGEYKGRVEEYKVEGEAYMNQCELFELKVGDFTPLHECLSDLLLLKAVWDCMSMVSSTFEDWKTTLWDMINTELLTDETKRIRDGVKKLPKSSREWGVFVFVDQMVADMLLALPVIQMLKSRSMRDRHWEELMVVTGSHFELDSNFCLADLLALNLHTCVEEVENVVIKSQKELNIEKNLAKISDVWDKLELFYTPYSKDENVSLVKIGEEVLEAYEEHQLSLQGIQSSKYVAVFAKEVNTWLAHLGAVENVTTMWTTVQQKWVQLEAIFIGSDDIRAQLPEDSKRFDIIDQDFREYAGESQHILSVKEACTRGEVLEKLEKMDEMLELCQKALDEYLGTKRAAFPRFYFVAPQDLLDILSKGSNPLDIQHHISKCFDNIGSLRFDPQQIPTGRANTAIGMYSSEKEYVEFHQPFVAEGAVEHYMAALVQHHKTTIKYVIKESLGDYSPIGRSAWMMRHCCQVVLTVSMIVWNREVAMAFERLEEGDENALKTQWQFQVDQLFPLAAVVRGSLEAGDRRKIVTLMTIDVHARDVIDKLLQKKVENSTCFEWLSQLRLMWDVKLDSCTIDIADARFIYGYEYVGNCGRLVITPLTDRCYITLTQALRLKMGGAPAGPAGTGKTETTKDLGRALGMIVYVFNCSEQMNSGVMGNIFKGLSASGSWGCFDEFNRIAIEVLSVVATQFRCVLQAIRSHTAFPSPHIVAGKFLFDGEECEIVPTAMGFITMNPGYAGRTELPENVKALFRSVAMIVPDFEMICEIMLFSEGFGEARAMARKFMMLFRLNKDLLSVQVHYDWGLRAVKSILVIAGSLKRADPDVVEDGVLLRALRDSNLTKLVAQDVEVFLGLINDLFPGYDLPRKRDAPMESLLHALCREGNLQPVDNFITKIASLRELFDVRHSVFVIGPPGSGKSSVWRMLAGAQTAMGTKTLFECINPKAQTTNELYGFIHPTVGWKDGIFSFLMRNFSQMASTSDSWAKWIVLDGEVDPNPNPNP